VAAFYPGFWLLESSILAEPLTLLLLGSCMLAVWHLRRSPTLAASMGVGALCGVAALTRSEQILFLVLVVVPVLGLNRALTHGRRLLLIGCATLTAGVVIAPWSIYNASRFEDPVLLSLNGPGTFLAGNCPHLSYRGPLIGYAGLECPLAVTRQAEADAGRDLDPSELQGPMLRAGIGNILDNKLDAAKVAPLRLGRSLGVFRPGQTIRIQAAFLNTGTAPVWSWVVAYWILVPLAIVGAVVALRARQFVWPILAPTVVAVLLVLSVLGEPRWHSAGDVGVVVLAAAAVARFTRPAT
jgi:hypothetical protein